LIKKIIDSKDNNLAKAMRILLKERKEDFRLVKSFELVIPTDYNHSLALNSDGLKDKALVAAEITSENFNEGSTKLLAGETFTVGIWEVLELKPLKECLEFLKKMDGAILAGARGALLVLKHKVDQLPLNAHCYCLDESNHLGR